MTPETLLQHAARIIAERQAVYGDPATSMATVAARWTSAICGWR